MARTMLLDPQTWDLALDQAGNMALADEGYGLAQDAASAIKTFLGECYFDTTIGVPYLSKVLSKNPPLTLLKQYLVDAALSVPGIASARVFVTVFANRQVAGQVQVTSQASGQTAAVNFSVVNPQGVG